MTEFLLPTLSCPFPSRLNKYVTELEEYSISWLRQFNILTNESDYERFRTAKFYTLTASNYPDCNLEELKIANDWMSWLFILDEQCDLSDLRNQSKILENYHNRFLEILNGAKLKNEDLSITCALYDIRRRMIEIGNIKSFVYCTQTIKEYFQGCVQETINRSQNIVPDVDDYIKIRRLTGAMDTAIELIIFCNHLIISDFLRENEIVKQISLMTNKIVCWDNDIASAYREITSGDVHNLVFLLHHHKHISITEAINLAVMMRNQELENMINLETSLPFFGEEIDTELAKYISGLHTWIRGNIEWSRLTNRYQSLEILTTIHF